MKSTLFKLLPNKTQAQQINITFGQESDEFIEILSDVKINDTFILSDMSPWKDISIITIKD